MHYTTRVNGEHPALNLLYIRSNPLISPAVTCLRVVVGVKKKKKNVSLSAVSGTKKVPSKLELIQ